MSENWRLLMDKAERALGAARRALADDDGETAADRAYYAVFYAAWALLDFRQIRRPKTHNGLIAEFSREYVKSGELPPLLGAILSRLENLRLVADYTPEPVPIADAERSVIEAEQFCGEVRKWAALCPVRPGTSPGQNAGD